MRWPGYFMDDCGLVSNITTSYPTMKSTADIGWTGLSVEPTPPSQQYDYNILGFLLRLFINQKRQTSSNAESTPSAGVFLRE